jgi:hypothetical protein
MSVVMPRVLGVEDVPVDAVRLSRLAPNKSLAAAQILAGRDRHKVCRINAASMQTSKRTRTIAIGRVAQVVNHQPVRDWPDEQFIRDTVR